ncbi:MAG: hypothetical protein HZC37_26660 [Burkholderiales bacterium]|nr:hypothetical protein [Burkholderiales bacterium]
MKRYLLAAAVAAATAFSAAPALAETPDDISFNGMWNVCDENKDGGVTRAEFVKAMGVMYDKQMKKAKSMPNADKMMKGDALTAAGLRELFKSTYPGP